jgi:cytochrome c peroxidase
MARSWDALMQDRSPIVSRLLAHHPFPAVGLFVLILCAGVLLAGTQAPSAPQTTSPPSAATPDDEPITPIPAPPIVDPAKLALGERLFDDVRLSAKGNLACSSCHDLRTNGADGHAAQSRNVATDGGTSNESGKSKLDILTVFNAPLSFRLTWQGSFRTLAAQAEASFSSTDLQSSTAEVVSRLNADPDMVRRFQAAYGRNPDRDSLLDALATFERTLLTPGSRFDRWLEGDESALSADELEGYRLFKSFGCGSCHQGVNIGGNLFQRQGVFQTLVETGPKIVRVPSLRNVATTAPYFHDGSARTLEEAVRRMAVAQLNRTLTDQQVTLLVAFLKSLTGNYRGSPVVGAKP